MKGIVLSFDPHLEIANLVVETYNQLWPDYRFQFRIPFTDRDPRSIFRAQNVEFISTPPDIRSTLESLLCDLPEHEFVFWCIDDRYPIEIFEPAVLRAVRDFASDAPSDIDSIKLTDLTVEGIEGKLHTQGRNATTPAMANAKLAWAAFSSSQCSASGKRKDVAAAGRSGGQRTRV